MAKRPSLQDILEEVGERIAEARRAADVTQEQAASRAGIDYKRWQRLEQGEVNATIRTLHRVAEALDTSFWELLAPSRRARR